MSFFLYFFIALLLGGSSLMLGLALGGEIGLLIVAAIWAAILMSSIRSLRVENRELSKRLEKLESIQRAQEDAPRAQEKIAQVAAEELRESAGD